MSKQKKKAKVAPRGAVVRFFNYTSECCGKPAKKPPVERTPEDRAAGEWSQSGMGTWRCTQCERVCKVKRSRIKETDGTGSTSGTAEASQAGTN